MPYEVLARKWRPQVFQDVVGQAHVTQTLVNAVKTGRLADAYLFSGPRGVGKTSVARILSKAINCERDTSGTPCNECTACTEITSGISVDVQEIDGASNRGIDEIRELRENVKYLPSASRYRIYIIDEVHMLTLQAFNALLKTLEEPPRHVKFIFATTEAHKVPVTILSRCQRFDFKRIPPARIVPYLESICQAEGIRIPRTALTLIAREADGSMRDAERLLDQVVSFAGTGVEDRDVIATLGLMDQDLIFETAEALLGGQALKCLELVARIYDFGYDLKEFYRLLMQQFRDLLLSLLDETGALVDLGTEERARCLALARTAGAERLEFTLNFLLTREVELRQTVHPRLALEVTLVKAASLGAYVSFGELLQKVDALAQGLGTGQSAPACPPDEPAPMPQATPKAAPAGADTAREVAADWPGLLKFVAPQNRIMANVLSDLRFLELGAGVLKLGKGAKGFSGTYLDDKDNLAQLTDYARRYFKRDLSIRLVEEEAGVPQAQRQAPRPAPDLPPPVQEILTLFDGEIQSQHPSESAAREAEEPESVGEEVQDERFT